MATRENGLAATDTPLPSPADAGSIRSCELKHRLELSNPVFGTRHGRVDPVGTFQIGTRLASVAKLPVDERATVENLGLVGQQPQCRLAIGQGLFGAPQKTVDPAFVVVGPAEIRDEPNGFAVIRGGLLVAFPGDIGIAKEIIDAALHVICQIFTTKTLNIHINCKVEVLSFHGLVGLPASLGHVGLLGYDREKRRAEGDQN